MDCRVNVSRNRPFHPSLVGSTVEVGEIAERQGDLLPASAGCSRGISPVAPTQKKEGKVESKPANFQATMPGKDDWVGWWLRLSIAHSEGSARGEFARRSLTFIPLFATKPGRCSAANFYQLGECPGEFRSSEVCQSLRSRFSKRSRCLLTAG